jgi:hypothetical protein
MNKELLAALREYNKAVRVIMVKVADSIYVAGSGAADFRAFAKADVDLFRELAKAEKALETAPTPPTPPTAA